jgi:hypothetical protein
MPTMSGPSGTLPPEIAALHLRIFSCFPKMPVLSFEDSKGYYLQQVDSSVSSELFVLIIHLQLSAKSTLGQVFGIPCPCVHPLQLQC